MTSFCDPLVSVGIFLHPSMNSLIEITSFTLRKSGIDLGWSHVPFLSCKFLSGLSFFTAFRVVPILTLRERDSIYLLCTCWCNKWKI